MSLKPKPVSTNPFILCLVIVTELLVCSKQEAVMNQNSSAIEESSVSLTERSSCNQMVLYQPVLPVLQQDKRLFQFAGRSWEISQQWDQIGLSAVIWEAVRFI